MVSKMNHELYGIDMWLFSVIWPLFTVICLGFLINFSRMKKMMTEMMESKAMLFLMWIVNLILWLVIINTITPTWLEMWILYIIGWAALLKWIVLNLFPKLVKKQWLSVMKWNDYLMQWWLFVFALFGVWMSWIVYIS